jgi:outer membrane protein
MTNNRMQKIIKTSYMFSKQRTFSFLFLYFIAINVSLAQKSFTLEEAIAYATQNAISSKMSEADIAISEAQIMEYRAIGIPKVNAVAGYNYFFAIPTQILPDFLGPAVDGRLLQYELIDNSEVIPSSGRGLAAQFGTRNSVSAGIEASFMMFDASFFTGLKAIKRAREFAQRQKQLTHADIRHAVTEAYITAVYNELTIDYLRKDIQNLGSILKESRLLFENGFVEQLDVDRLDLSFANLQIEEEKLLQFREIAMNILKFQMNYPMSEVIILEDDLERLMFMLQLSPEESGSAVNYFDRPEYQVLDMSKTLNELQIKSNEQGYYPTLRGFANYNTQLFRNDLFDSNENGWFPSSIAGLSLNVPIFDGNQRKGQLRQQKLELEKIRLQTTMLENTINLQTNNGRKNLLNAENTLKSRGKNLELAERIYTTAQLKYKEGVGSSVELSQAESELFRTQSNYLNALYEVAMARFELKKALGKI